jgi:hypothetical protein
MSIIIKGEPMPEACAFCPCFRDDSIDGVHAYQCKATFITYGKEDDCIWNTRPNWCPLVELPEKHGRLIDADELKTAFPRCDNNMDIKIASVRATINHMPTIIEAEGMEG